MKLLATAAAALLGLAATADAQCVNINFTQRATDFTTLNTVLDLAVSANLLAGFLDDPLVLENQVISVEQFDFLGSTFNVTPTLDSLNITGLTKIVPRHINVTGDDSLQIGADFSGELSVAATLSVEFEQLDHKWYQVCWTDILHPATCPPATITVDVALALNKPSVAFNGTFDMFACAAGVASSVCKNVTVSNILTAALTGQLEALLGRILTRFESASIDDLSVGFDAVTNIDFNLHGSSVLITQIANSLLDYTAAEINKKSVAYQVLIAIVNSAGKDILNDLIQSELAPQFGATCLGT